MLVCTLPVPMCLHCCKLLSSLFWLSSFSPPTEMVEQGMAEIKKLNSIIKSVEASMLLQRKEYETGAPAAAHTVACLCLTHHFLAGSFAAAFFVSCSPVSPSVSLSRSLSRS